MSTFKFIIGIAAIAGIGVAFAFNQTPIIGNFAPTANLYFGFDRQNPDETKMKEAKKITQQIDGQKKIAKVNREEMAKNKAEKNAEQKQN